MLIKIDLSTLYVLFFHDRVLPLWVTRVYKVMILDVDKENRQKPDPLWETVSGRNQIIPTALFELSAMRLS